MEALSRQPGESVLEHHKRLVYGKLKDGTLSDRDYSELAPYIYGKDYGSDITRKMMYGSRKTLDLISGDLEEYESCGENESGESREMSELDKKIIEFKMEKQKYLDHRTAFNKTLRERARQEELNEILVSAINSSSMPPLKYDPKPEYVSDNDLLVSLNDIHYGADVNNYWNVYNSTVCRSMMERYLEQVIRIAGVHQSENCIVWANGDEISGNIHYSLAVTNKENVIKQVQGVSELISEFIAELSEHFSHVYYVSVAGNHSRLDPNKDRALNSERLDDLVEWYLKARLQNFENVTIGFGEKVDDTMYIMNVRGKNYCGVHGDFDGSPSKVQALQTMAERPLYAVLSGHLHHNKVDDVQGVKTVMAGSFLGMDDFCVQKRIYGKPEQMVCVCDEDGIRCMYPVPLK